MERTPHGGTTWMIAGERIALLAWPRAILLQLAHPLVAAGVAQHSGFRDSLLAPFTRLRSTVRRMRHLTFGSDEQAAAALRAIRRVHDRVSGTARGVAGQGGVQYSAHDPALLLWVHATLLDSHARILEPILGPFEPGELDRYCRETAPLAAALGASPDAVPLTWRELQDYMADQMESGPVAVGADARALAPSVLRPPILRFAWPLQYAGELVTVGSLPGAIRQGYGFTWDAARERRMRRAIAAFRAARRLTPDRLARWPEACTPHRPESERSWRDIDETVPATDRPPGPRTP